MPRAPPNLRPRLSQRLKNAPPTSTGTRADGAWTRHAPTLASDPTPPQAQRGAWGGPSGAWPRRRETGTRRRFFGGVAFCRFGVRGLIPYRYPFGSVAEKRAFFAFSEIIRIYRPLPLFGTFLGHFLCLGMFSKHLQKSEEPSFRFACFFIPLKQSRLRKRQNVKTAIFSACARTHCVRSLPDLQQQKNQPEKP